MPTFVRWKYDIDSSEVAIIRSATEWEGYVTSFQSSSCHIPHSHAIIHDLVTQCRQHDCDFWYFLPFTTVSPHTHTLFVRLCFRDPAPAQSHSTFAPAPAVEPGPLALPCHTLSCSSYPLAWLLGTPASSCWRTNTTRSWNYNGNWDYWIAVAK